MQLMNGNPPLSVLPSLSRDRCADSMAPSLKELSFMEADLSERHKWLQAFGCPMYFQAKSLCFTPNIQRPYQRWKPFLSRVQQMPLFFPDYFWMSMHINIFFGCLGNTLIDKCILFASFFLIWGTRFTLFSLDPIPSTHILICSLKPVLSLHVFTSYKIYNATLSSLISKLKKEN